MNEDRKKRGLANGKFFTAVAICALFLGSGNVMAAQTASNDSQGVQEQMQSISVTVTVVDTKGEPIIGANVIEKGTTNGGITDLDGVSKLNVKPGSNTKNIICGLSDTRSEGSQNDENNSERRYRDAG